MNTDSLKKWLFERGLLDVAGALRHPVLAAGRRRETGHATIWARRQAEPVESLVGATAHRELWDETQSFVSRLESLAARRLKGLESLQLGGGGVYPLLYYLTRLRQPEIVVETGVSVGWSSTAILHALRQNGSGHLWSSELPYQPRYSDVDYAQYRGLLVDKDLRDRWTLLLDGDRENLPQIATSVGQVDLFHYDSDKSYEGREFASALLEPVLAKDAIVIFDDIQNNLHFRDWSRGRPARVAYFEGKYVGVVGLPKVETSPSGRD